MSKNKRNITFWSIAFLHEGERMIDADLFQQFISYFSALPPRTKLKNDKGNSKATEIKEIVPLTRNDTIYYKVLLQTCKYNHSPNYMSSVDGSERPSQKAMIEGEAEKTHFCMKLKDDELVCVLESRQSGVTINGIVSYLNYFFEEYRKVNPQANGFIFDLAIIPSEDFITSINKTKRISILEVLYDKAMLGSEGMHLGEFSTESKDEITVTIKANRADSFKKQFVNGLFELFSGGSSIRRIRVKAKNENDSMIIIDSNVNKKVSDVSVELSPEGVVKSDSIFDKMLNILDGI